MQPQSMITTPRLENGDRLSRGEFERRYQLMARSFKAELIEGVVYVAAAVRANSHGKPHARILAWLGTYCAATPGVDFADNSTVRLDSDNEPQPDAALWIAPEAGGQVRIAEDDYLEGSPELVIEIAASSASYDLHDKLKVYRRNGVREYLVWQVLDHRLDWFHLRDGTYASLPINESKVIQSQVFPGLWLAVDALLAGDLAKVLSVARAGTDSPEHQNFIQRLSGLTSP
jgi:Uma2 family endonuclease